MIEESSYIILLVGLFLIPRLLQRIYIPTAISGFALGIISGAGFGLFIHDPIIKLFSVFGIVSLFLIAGLEVDTDELKAEMRFMIQHLIIRLMLFAIVTISVSMILDLDRRLSSLIALALLTPSTGFILDSLDGLAVTESELFWIKSKAISSELLALIILFIALNSSSLSQLSLSVVAIAGIIIFLPFIFSMFGRFIITIDPKSEFAFLIIIATVSAYLTKKLGVYYLVGAFIVGITAQRFTKQIPTINSRKMFYAIESFVSLFVPFYFFKAGLLLQPDDITIKSVVTGLLFFIIITPVRLASIILHRRVIFSEPFRKSVRIGITILPTLVFTLVIGQIAKEHFNIPQFLFGGLIVYTIITTLFPIICLGVRQPEFEFPNLVREVGKSEK